MAQGSPRPGQSLPGGYRIEALAESTTVSPDDVLRLWAAEEALSGDRARARLEQVQYVTSHVDDGLVGVTTLYLEHNPQLGVDSWYGRIYVAEKHRTTNVATIMGTVNEEILDERYVSGEDRRAPCVAIEIENADIKRLLNLGRWDIGYVFVGENRRGDHVRVKYFTGAEVPGPRLPDAIPTAPPELRVEAVDGQLDGRRADAIIRFWGDHGVLRGDDARSRLPDIVAVVTDGTDVRGTSSVQRIQVGELGGRWFWLHRRFLPGLTTTPLDAELFLAVHAAVERDHRVGVDEPAGSVVVVDDGAPVEPTTEAVWPRTGLLHAGALPDGRWLRLRYFDDAVIA